MPASPRSLLMQSRNLLPRLQSSKWYSSNSSGKGLNGEPQQALSLQAFFDYAHDLAVSGSLQSDGVNVRGVAKLMSELPLSELGLRESFVRDPEAGAQSLALAPGRILYLPIFEDAHMTLGVFCLGKGAVIPLHDHFDMSVVSRLLFGRMSLKSYDWVKPARASRSLRVAEARPVQDVVLQAPTEPMLLFPESGGNIHEFRAETSCAVLDLLTPPYQSPERDCAYYRVVDGDGDAERTSSSPFARLFGSMRSGSSSNGSGSNGSSSSSSGSSSGEATPTSSPKKEGHVFLTEYEPPSSFQVLGGEYTGERIVVRESDL